MSRKTGGLRSGDTGLWPVDMMTHVIQFPESIHPLPTPFLRVARPSQRLPILDPLTPYRTWLFMGGHGAGKTRAGAEWTSLAARHSRIRRIALVGQTLSDVREVMIEGESGLRRLSHAGARPRYEASRRRLIWDDAGVVAHCFSAEDPDSLRGPVFDFAWCDELASWTYGEETWNTLAMGLRGGAYPLAIATTTPRPLPWLRDLIARPDTRVTRSTTAENAENLAPGFVETMRQTYGSGQLARQELDGELIDDPEGALWPRRLIDQARVRHATDLERIVVAVDPPVTSGPGSDACGIIAAGSDGCDPAHLFVLKDASLPQARPMAWASRAVQLATEIGAEAIYVEANQGGEMVAEILRQAGATIPVRRVFAKLNKRARAAPVVGLYEAGRVHHVGAFPQLEDEMYSFGAPGFRGSPDRLDALVWAVTVLTQNIATPRIRVL